MSLILKYDLGNPHRLPVGYTPLAYIESSGTLWIDTGWLPTGNTQEVNIHFIPTASLSSKSICGGQPASSAPRNFILHSGSYFYTADNYISCTAYNTINLKYHVRMTNNVNSKLATVTVNGTTTNYAYNTATLTTTYTYHLFTNNNGGNKTSQASSCKIYYCNIINNGSMFGEYIPAKRNSDGVIGMFDIVSQTFKTNAGTGSFIAGPEVVVLPYEYLLVEYLEALPKSSYINTGVKPSANLGTELGYCGIDLGSSENIFFGASNLSGYAGNPNYCMETCGSTLNIAFNTGYLSVSFTANSGQRYKLQLNINGDKQYKIDGVVKITFSANDNLPTNYNLFLFKRSVSGGGNDSYNVYTTRLEYCKMWDGTTLVRNMIPCYRRSDLKPGMYDIVNNVFYTNSGSGEFVLGPTVEESTRQLEYNNASSNYIGLPTNIHHSIEHHESGLNNGCAEFNGSTSKILTDFNWNPGKNFTVSVWIKKKNGANIVGSVVRNDTKYSPIIDFDGGNSLRCFFWYSADSYRMLSLGTIVGNNWTHIVMTYNGSNLVAYVNGIQNSSLACTESPYNTGKLVIGYNENVGWINGYMNDLRIYDNALTANEVLNLYNKGL